MMTKKSVMTKTKPNRFTGWHMFAILVAFFGVVFGVNFTLARLASQTFGGEVVKNSYDASQNFNHWLDEAAKEKALGWDIIASRSAAGKVAITLKGAPKTGVSVEALARHPLGTTPDQPLRFTADNRGTFVSREVLPQGRWRLRITVSNSGHNYRTEEDLP
jgi:nitrogen fixation protein FixH